MANTARKSEYDRQPGETSLEYSLRKARLRANSRSKDEALVTPEAERHGEYIETTVYHHDAEGRVSGVRTKRNRKSSVVDKWFEEGGMGFDAGAKAAVERCHTYWEARPTIGKLCATYGPTVGGGGRGIDDYPVLIKDDIDRFKSWFHPAYWEIFEAVVRWGRPAGVAGSELATNPAQAIASAKVVVGMVASYIAAKEGY